MAALDYDSIYDRVRSASLLGKSAAQLPDASMSVEAHDIAAELFARYPCLGTEESLAVTGVEVRLLEQAIAAKLAAVLSEGASGQTLLGASEIKQGSVTIKRGGVAVSTEATIKGFWDSYASALRGIGCVGAGGRAIFATSGARTEPGNVLDDAYGPVGA